MITHDEDITTEDDSLRLEAKYIAITVRNAMEGFHVAHLSDQQMKELNPIIRNAVFTALHAQANAEDNEGSRVYVQFQGHLIPEYWEDPVLLEEYERLMTATQERKERVEKREANG